MSGNTSVSRHWDSMVEYLSTGNSCKWENQQLHEIVCKHLMVMRLVPENKLI